MVSHCAGCPSKKASHAWEAFSFNPPNCYTVCTPFSPKRKWLLLRRSEARSVRDDIRVFIVPLPMLSLCSYCITLCRVVK